MATQPDDIEDDEGEAPPDGWVRTVAPADDSETFDDSPQMQPMASGDAPPGGLHIPFPSGSQVMDFAAAHPGLATLVGGPLLGGAGAASNFMAPSQDLQLRVDQAKALPPGAPAPTPGSPAQPYGPYMPQGGLPPPGPPRLGMPGHDWKGDDQQIQAGSDLEQKGAQQAADAETKAAQIRAQTAADVAAQRQQYAQQSQAARDAAFADVKGKQDAIQKQMDDLDKAHVDKASPDGGFWASRSIAQKAFAGLGLAMSNFGAAFTHTQAVDLISPAIDRAVAAQKENIQSQKESIANRRAGLGQKMNLLESNYRILGNYQDATDMTKAHLFDALAQAGEAQAAQAATPEIQGRMMQVVGQLKQKSVELKQGTYSRQAQAAYQGNMLAQEQYKNQLEAWQLRRQMQFGPGGPPSPEQQKELADQEASLRTATSAAKENADALKSVGVGDRLQHYASKVVPFVPDAPVYGKLAGAREAMAVKGNAALGSKNSPTKEQLDNMYEGADQPNSPAKGVAFSQSSVAQWRDALANTYASTYRIPIEQARAMVDQKFANPWREGADADEIRAKYGPK